jgi:hypothetical protein
MAEEKFKLPRSSYEELCKIIKSYGRLSKPASLDEVAKLCAMNKTAISANNAFLTNIELIEGGKAKSATVKGNELSKALEHEIPDQIEESWAQIVRENEFLGKMAAAVKIRGKMESTALESHVAYSAGETKSGPVMTGARAVIDILRAAGVVREHEGQLVARESETEVRQKEVTQPSLGSPEGVATSNLATGSFTIPVAQSSGISLHIELRIDAKPSELDGLGPKIRKLLSELNSTEDSGADEDAVDS